MHKTEKAGHCRSPAATAHRLTFRAPTDLLREVGRLVDVAVALLLQLVDDLALFLRLILVVLDLLLEVLLRLAVQLHQVQLLVRVLRRLPHVLLGLREGGEEGVRREGGGRQRNRMEGRRMEDTRFSCLFVFSVAFRMFCEREEGVGEASGRQQDLSGLKREKEMEMDG